MIPAFCEGFAPVFDDKSRVLILGSFPSVKSRAVGFYYGNPQNKFWRTLGAFFHEEPPKEADGRRAYVLKHGVALWDVVLSCTIAGSSDASIERETVADVASTGCLQSTSPSLSPSQRSCPPLPPPIRAFVRSRGSRPFGRRFRKGRPARIKPVRGHEEKI